MGLSPFFKLTPSFRDLEMGMRKAVTAVAMFAVNAFLQQSVTAARLRSVSSRSPKINRVHRRVENIRYRYPGLVIWTIITGRKKRYGWCADSDGGD